MKTILLLGFGVLICSVQLSAFAAESAEVAEPAEPGVIQATETATLLEKSGEQVVVEGRIARIGPSPTGAINFLNFTTTRNGFVALVYEKDMGAFPDGLDHFFNQTVRVSGEMRIYDNTTPQIVLSSPEQIEIVSE